MNIVCPAFFVVVFFHFFYSHTFIPWESKVFLISFEVVFYVALGTYKGTHFLVSRFVDVFSLASKSLCQRWLVYFQTHSLGIVASSTTDRVHYFATPLVPRSTIVFFQTYFLHKARYIRTLTSPASTWLWRVGSLRRRSCTEDFGNILYGMHVATRCIVFLREGIARPKDYHFRT